MCAVDPTSTVFEAVSVSNDHLVVIMKLTGDRDDLTVEVIFFGNTDKSGDVVVNKEASATPKDIKAKL
jgi:hypothetical protein